MFCHKCGSQMQEGDAFCATCGATPVKAEPKVSMEEFQAQKNAVRKSEIAELEKALAYFSQKADDYEYYSAAKTLYGYYLGGAKKSLIVWGAIIFAIGFLVAIADASAFMGGLIAFMIPGGAMIAGGVLMQVNNKKKKAYYQSESLRMARELNEYYAAYPDCPFGIEYAHPDDIELMLGVLRSGRADTIKESINLLIKEAKDEEDRAYMRALEEALGI